jgi:hypothetical protein
MDTLKIKASINIQKILTPIMILSTEDSKDL